MVESFAKVIDAKRILRCNIDKYKEYFIKFYGESERERIEEAFSKILLIPYMTIQFAGTILLKLRDEITNSILEKYSKKLKPYELKGNGNFSWLDYFDLYQYIQLVEELNKDEKDEKIINKLFSKLGYLLAKIDEDITPSTFFNYTNNPVYQELEFLSENFSCMQLEFDKIYSKFKSYETLVYKEWKIQDAIERKYYKKFIKDNLINLPNDIRKVVEEELKLYKTDIPKTIKAVFGSKIKEFLYVNNFLSETEQRSINESRVKHIKDCQLEIQKNYFICEQYQEELDMLGLLNPVKLEEEMDAGTTACLPNVRKVNGKYDIFCPILICFEENKIDNIDHNIVHELNHLLELALIDANEKGYNILSGWDLITYSKDESKENNFRKYELFNEAINELITQDICKEMHKDKFFLFDTSNAIYDQSGYELTLYLVEEFYEKYKDKILESRKNGNIGIIWDIVGKENFDELNSLFAVHYDKEKDEMMACEQIRDEQERKKVEILRRMEEYSNKNLEESNFGKCK